MAEEALLRFEQVQIAYTNDSSEVVKAVHDFSLDIREGEFVSLVGPSGCGKTSLMEAVAGLRSITEGEIRVSGKPVKGVPKEVGIVFQEDATFPWRTVLSNVEFGLEVAGVGKDIRRRTAREMITLVGLAGFEDLHPPQLSGGMRQRVSIARALVTKPALLLMDEPFGALDEQTRLYIGRELLRIWAETKNTVLFITHSIQEAVLLSNRVIVMSARPGTVKEVVEVNLPEPRGDATLERDEFGRLTAHIWGLLRHEMARDA
jgi:NitT/TauT family transport system ATP-binding protein